MIIPGTRASYGRGCDTRSSFYKELCKDSSVSHEMKSICKTGKYCDVMSQWVREIYHANDIKCSYCSSKLCNSADTMHFNLILIMLLFVVKYMFYELLKH